MTTLEKRIRLAGLLIAIGLLVQLITLNWVHAISFMASMIIVIPLVLAGIAIFLLSLVSVRQ
jgi:hypothetical protein